MQRKEIMKVLNNKTEHIISDETPVYTAEPFDVKAYERKMQQGQRAQMGGHPFAQFM